MLLELRRAGFEPDYKRVDTEQEYLAALNPEVDIILSDYSMPQFDGLRALILLQDQELDIPFILVTGGFEELGIACLKQGAADYLIKDRLGRLGPAVSQALEEKELRAEKRQAEQALQESAERYRTLFEDSRDAIVIANGAGRVIDFNYAALRMFGYYRHEMLEIDDRDLFVDPKQANRFAEQLDQHGSVRDFTAKLRTKDGDEMDCLVAASQRRAGDGTGLARNSVIRSIEAQK
jgi:PAS domain S-box-containing protein